MQVIFSAIFYIVSVSLFPGFLMVGYATIFTMFPVFSLVLDKDVHDSIAMTYPELYKDLAKGRELTIKTFLIWVIISIYQGMFFPSPFPLLLFGFSMDFARCLISLCSSSLSTFNLVEVSIFWISRQYFIDLFDYNLGNMNSRQDCLLFFI